MKPAAANDMATVMNLNVDDERLWDTNLWLEFLVPSLQAEFLRFRVLTTPRLYCLVFAIVLTLFFSVHWLLVLIYFADASEVACFLLSSLFLVMTWTVWVIKRSRPKNQYQDIQRQLLYCENLLIIFGCVSIAMVFWLRAWHGQCASNDFEKLWGCSPVAEARGLPVDTVLTLMAFPLFCSMIYPFIVNRILLSCYLFNVLVIGLAMILFHATVAITVCLLIICSFLVLQYVYSTQLVDFFISTVKSELLTRTRGVEKAAQAERETEAMRQVISRVAHDMTTPLVAFGCGVETVKGIFREMESNPQFLSALEGLQMSELFCSLRSSIQSFHFTHLQVMMILNRCLDYCKVVKNVPLVPTMESFELSLIFKVILDYVREFHSNISIRLDESWRTTHDKILADRRWLQENLICLVTNAIKYSNGGEVVVKCYLQERMLVFEVIDEGVGINGNNADHFFALPAIDAERQMGGVGLGLYCLAQRTLAMGGEFGAYNRKDRNNGAVVWFSIPLVRCTEDATMLPALSGEIRSVRSANDFDQRVDEIQIHSASPVNPNRSLQNSMGCMASESNSTKEADMRSLQILIVDDSAPILKMLKMMLQRHRHEVMITTNGYEALELLEEGVRAKERARAQEDEEVMKENGSSNPEIIPQHLLSRVGFDAVLMDIQMPIIDGCETIRRWRQFESEHYLRDLDSDGGKEWKHLPLIIAMSANADHLTKQDAFLAGADYFLFKPFNMDAFHNIMHQHRHLL